MGCSPTCSRRGGVGPSVPADVMAAVIVLQALHGLVGRRDGGRGDLRSAVEGGVRAAGDGGGVPPDDVDVLAARLAASRAAEPDLRRGPAGDRADRGAGGQDPAGVGLHGAGRRGGHPGHGHPVDRARSAGSAGRCPAPRRVVAAAVHRARLRRPGQAGDRLGRPAGPGRAGRRAGRRRAPAARAPARAASSGRRPPRRWRCWRWSPGRTSNRPRIPTAPTGGGGSRSGSPRTG